MRRCRSRRIAATRRAARATLPASTGAEGGGEKTGDRAGEQHNIDGVRFPRKKEASKNIERREKKVSPFITMVSFFCEVLHCRERERRGISVLVYNCSSSSNDLARFFSLKTLSLGLSAGAQFTD